MLKAMEKYKLVQPEEIRAQSAAYAQGFRCVQILKKMYYFE